MTHCSKSIQIFWVSLYLSIVNLLLFIVNSVILQRFPDKVEADYEAALRINVESSRNIAEACKEVGARMIYISTDYVFDGSHPPYFPDNEPHPLNKYGESKLGGEKAVLAVDDKFLVLRIPVLYGGVTKLNESAVTILLDVVRYKQTRTLGAKVRPLCGQNE